MQIYSFAVTVFAAKAQQAHLVGHIKEGQQVPGLADVCNLAPLLSGGVNACGVVCTACKTQQQSHHKIVGLCAQPADRPPQQSHHKPCADC